MLEGTRTSLVQAGFQLRYWLLAMQHFSNGVDAPCNLRSDENFQVSNPKRADNSSRKIPPTANDGVFLGYRDSACFSGVSISAYARGTCW